MKSPTEGFFKDRGSKFYAHAYPVETQAELEQRIQELKKKYHDARHHCYAYRLGIKADKSFSNDDGEPSHSAGTPILSAIRSAEMSNILIVVVRYFGGTKLGIRGLIDAYGTAAKEALEQAESYPMIPMIRFTLKFSYEQTSA
ncbi:MAG: YigZ family protein, partial [Bacteroidota bacterium]